MLACKLCLVSAPASEQAEAIKRLIDIMSGVDWILRDDIEACLTAHAEIAKGVIDEHVATSDALGGAAAAVLRRVRARAMC